jgi:hypothetical protein
VVAAGGNSNGGSICFNAGGRSDLVSKAAANSSTASIRCFSTSRTAHAMNMAAVVAVAATLAPIVLGFCTPCVILTAPLRSSVFRPQLS